MSDFMREEFEAWVLGKWPKTSMKKISAESGAIYSVGNYVEPAALLAWESWKASRETLVIELPKPGSDDGDSWDQCFKSGVSQCRAAIHAAGVKTK